MRCVIVIFHVIMTYDMHHQAFHLVDKGSFRRLLRYLRPSLSDRDIPHRTKTRDEILERAKVTIQCVKEKLKHVDSKISFTFDSWTSEPGVPFLSITAHYIDSPAGKPQEWELKTDQLSFTIINGNHSGNNIGRILIETIDNYDIRTKVGWFTADNATNNDTAIQTVAHAIDPSGTKWIAGKHRVR